MEMKKNKRNAASQHHGFWETYHDNDKKYVRYKCHYFNGNEIGYEEYFNSNGFISYKCHYFNNDRTLIDNDRTLIGCVQNESGQCFNNKHGKKFGEQIIWK